MKKTVWLIVFMLIFNGFIMMNQFMVPVVNAASPTVTTNSTTNITETSATLNGFLSDDSGENCDVWFEYGTSDSYGSSTPDEEILGELNEDDLTLKDTHDAGDDYYDVWGDGTYIYAACFFGGIRAYTFDGNSFTLEASHDASYNYYAVWGDGDYIYVARDSYGILAYSFDGSSFTLEDTYHSEWDEGGNYCDVYCCDGYIYAACKRDGIRAFSFDGSFTLEGTYDEGAVDYRGVWSDGTYVYAACDDHGIRAFTFDGSTFTLEDSHDDGEYRTVWGDGDYIYFACKPEGIRAYSFDGDTFTLKDTQDDGENYYNVWGDGTYIYTACQDASVRVYTFDGNSFTLEDERDDGGSLSVWGDGTYIYTACSGDGIRAYSQFGTYSIEKEFSYDLTALSPETTYHYRSVANNSDGTSYGLDMTFHTMPPGPPQNMTGGFNSTHSSINYTWDFGENADNTVVVRNNNSYPSSVTDGYEVQNSSSDWYNTSADDTFYLTAFSYNTTWNFYSTGVNMPWEENVITIDLDFDNFMDDGIFKVGFSPYVAILGNFTWGIIFGFIGAGLYANERSIAVISAYLILVGTFFSIILPYSVVYLFGLVLAFVLTVIFFVAFIRKKT